jgi:hypothetical protein
MWRWRVVVWISLAVIAAGVWGVLANCMAMSPGTSAAGANAAITGMIVWFVVVFIGVVVMVFGFVKLSGLRQQVYVETQTRSIEDAMQRGMRPGDMLGRMTVMECTDNSVLMSREDDPLRLGWVRLALAGAGLSVGLLVAYALYSGHFAMNPKAVLIAIGLILTPVALAVPFNVNWAASLTAADGEPGFVFERRFLFFFRSFDVIPLRDVREIKLSQSAKFSGLHVVRTGRRNRILVQDSSTPQKVGLMYALRGAVCGAIGADDLAA